MRLPIGSARQGARQAIPEDLSPVAHPTGFEPVASAFGGQGLVPKMAENRHRDYPKRRNIAGI